MTAERGGAPFLKRIKITSFGAFTDKVVGPFTPHLNVVFGENEAGKSTLASFAGGVLFGWEEARGVRNTYKPKNAERAGSLFFAPRPAEGDADDPDAELVLSRVKNVDGLQGPAELVDDIDRETFQTMFSLTSDELRSLRNTTDVTAKLLTAGSGTGASPAHALAEVQARLAEYTSKAAGIEHSIVRLAAEQDELRAQMTAAAEEAERYKGQDKEFHELAPQRAQLLARLDALNTSIEQLTAQRATLEKLDSQRETLRRQRDELREDEAALAAEHRVREQISDPALVSLGAADERALRDRIDALAEEQAKCAHSVDLAKENCATSTAAYEALLETDDAQEANEKRRSQRSVQVGLSIALPFVFVAAGVPLFMHGREINSLSFTALGIGLVVFALMLAAAALVMLFRPDKAAEALEARKQDAQWVMLQDKKKLETCLAAQQQLSARIRAQLDASGLAAAQGSLRSARSLLSEAKDARAEAGLFQQRQQALASRLSAVEDNLADVERQRARLIERAGLHEDATVAGIDAAIDQKTRQRAGLLETSENLNRRYGELKQELSQAKRAHSFDEIKLRYQQVRTRQDESAQDYARLLLARRMLEAAIGAWESKSQPEVYRQASRLLSLMTDGRWVKVAMTPEGRLQVTDSVKTEREPVHLSLGTCQQLYLALRIALLMTAENVGRSVPILADDILVNFDARRRLGAARALAELSRTRQVILFTCHEEIVESMRSVDPALNVVEL
ncbi:ATP-binding protein [Gordonibacter massiliensis (ex Traore et al. 2017)]|uniref:AAA family ATPase n=1 Tax=Gordonibacter massiliensis (ex Traore et al. 2017) TaxID=1841863 RepID=A0A842J7P6_9ACTN|nr:AAA family ATPase [Gordonibacter massiliensis (ex Traore et al. 2017)]MBC2888012.1 AAA family ATPase [Gordonibacter massiliensis (ex Traore et al. 2017)]